MKEFNSKEERNEWIRDQISNGISRLEVSKEVGLSERQITDICKGMRKSASPEMRMTGDVHNVIAGSVQADVIETQDLSFDTIKCKHGYIVYKFNEFMNDYYEYDDNINPIGISKNKTEILRTNNLQFDLVTKLGFSIDRARNVTSRLESTNQKDYIVNATIRDSLNRVEPYYILKTFQKVSDTTQANMSKLNSENDELRARLKALEEKLDSTL